ncbi:urease accessory protein UreF [Kocuria sp. KRD140]|uniref:urease accessory protein UreF n=1 Tax=Kocuria sp. KRD140 TaxID=2729723 RepID=UPI0019D0540C|nr:urease accessory protein UreF [Kocuria sp. KRD140]
MTGDAQDWAGSLLPLLQICDSALPTGAFAHTFGMETYLERGTVSDQASFQDWLERFLDHQLVYADGLAVRLTAELFAGTTANGASAGTAPDSDFDAGLVRLDALMFAQALPAQVRQAGLTMGRRLLEIGTLSLPGPGLERYARLVAEGTCRGHQAIVFALIGVDHGVPPAAITQAFLFSTLTSLTQNAVRGISIGQNAGQRTLGALRPRVAAAWERISALDMSDLGVVSPGLEIAQMHHETQRARMFMS